MQRAEPNPERSWSGTLDTLLGNRPLDPSACAWVVAEIMNGDASPVQIAAFAVALRAKGETSEEVNAIASSMLIHGMSLRTSQPVVDTCGTGGDRSGTVNLSTMAAVVVAATGVPVVKHGARAATSSCGSADVLEALGVAIDLKPPGVLACLGEVGIGFCFASVFYPALRHAAVARKELGIPTVFNVLGPLINPARPCAQTVGVPDPRTAALIADVLAQRKTCGLVVRGDDGLDEITTTCASTVWEARSGQVVTHRLDPRDYGINRSSRQALLGSSPGENARIFNEVMDGQGGAVRDAVLLNAAATLAAYEPSHADLPDRYQRGLNRAAAALDGGDAAALLEKWIKFSQNLQPTF